MEVKRVGIGQGLSWFGAGWRIFQTALGAWLVATIAYIGLSLILSFIPFVGPLVLTLIAPALFAGLLIMAHNARTGGEATAGMLFEGLSDPEIRGSLLLLGAVSIGAAVLAGAAFLVLGMGSVMAGAGMTSMSGGGEEAAFGAVAAMGSGFLLGLLVSLGIALLVTMALFYAVPLVALRGAEPVAAMKASIRAVLRNILPLLAFSVVYILLAILAAIPLGLGFLILFPVSAAAVYQSFEEIFPEAIPAAA